MEADELRRLYESVRGRRPDLPALGPEVVAVDVSTERIPSATAVQAKILSFAPVEGWIAFQSANRWFRDGRLPLIEPATGALLDAEVVDAGGHSLHVRYDGRGEWLVTEYRLAPGSTHFTDLVTHVGPSDVGWIRYRRFWRMSPELGADPFMACFIGFRQD